MGTSQTSLCVLYTLMYRSVWSTTVQYFYLKPTLSERKHKCSGDVDGTTTLLLKVCLVAQLYLTFANYGL